MDPPGAGHSPIVARAQSVMTQQASELAASPKDATANVVHPTFAELYETQFAFVWRSARRLGVPDHSLDDVVQDVFVTAYRRFADFEGRSKPSTWLFGILRRVVSDHRRSGARKRTEPLCEEPAAPMAEGPLHAAERADARSLVSDALAELDAPFREVFVLADLEQMTAPDIAEALELNLNTVYSRLRTARQRFERSLRRRMARAAPPGRNP